MKLGDKLLLVLEDGRRIEGTVTNIDDDGTITACQYPDTYAHPLRTESALSAIRQWHDLPPYEYGIEQ